MMYTSWQPTVAKWSLTSALALALTPPALAQTDEQPTTRARGLEEVVVTAQKISQNINDIGMSITAASGERLNELGIDDTADLVKMVPGFNFTPTLYGTPVYSIRGVGFLETTLSAGPTVSVYADEVPLPFTAMTRGTTLDIQRLEVLKGPQGTLFGQNSTGGAINYLANRPGEEFEAGVDASYGRFDRTDLQGFVSGPLTDTLRGRVAVRSTRSDGWQESYTRSDTLGEEDFLNGRIILEWEPTESLRTSLRVSGWQDKSDSPAPQYFGLIPRSGDPAGLPQGLIDYPASPRDNRDADWDPENDYARDNTFYMGALRVDYDLSDDLTLTSVTAYEKFERDQALEGDGTTFENYYSVQGGEIETVYQELRLAGSFRGMGNWMVGANYQEDETFDRFHQFYDDSASSVLDFGSGPIYGPDSIPTTWQDITTWAVFANAEYPILDSVTLQAGLRYTDSERDFQGCSFDSGDLSNAGWAGQSEAIQQLFRGGAFTPVPRGTCGTMGPPPDYIPGFTYDTLEEDNVSWRVNANWYVGQETLLYANVSQGYKAGSFPTLAVALSSQFEPVTQEKLLAYETGFKAGLLDGTLQLNGAVFYYDYEDKQILGNVLDIAFGPLPALVNVPEAEVKGFELSAAWAPVDGLLISPSISYQDSEVKGDFEDYNFLGNLQNFGGESFPAAPKVQADLDISYRWSVGPDWEAFVGAHANYQDDTYAFFGEQELLDIPSYTLVDLRAGVERGPWEITAWGRNVTDEYYWTNVTFASDAMVRFAGMPATYGLDVSYRMQ